MPMDPQLLAQVLNTPPERRVTQSPIVTAVILSDPANAADLVPALDGGQTLQAYNARQILSLFEASAVPHLLAQLLPAGPDGRKEGLEVVWALLTGEDARTVRDVLSAGKEDLDRLLDDKRPLPDHLPEHIERDFPGRICDLAFLVVRTLLDPEADVSIFRSADDPGRDAMIRQLKARGFGLSMNIA